jgi:hypothetical protein
VSYQTRTRELVIGESLQKCASLVETTGPKSWNFILNNGRMLLVAAHADDRWLHLRAQLESDAAARVDAWKLLHLNHQLGSGSFALARGEQTPHLRAEIALDEEVNLTLRLQEACAGLKAGVESLYTEKTKEHVKLNRGVSADETARQANSELLRLCEESGWPFDEKTATKFVFELEAGDGFYQAAVEEQGEGSVVVAVELARDEPFSEWSRRAVGLMLLRACGVVRFARAAVKERSERATALFEVVFPSLPGVVELNHALSALSVACRLCGREVRAMQDERIARNYLAAQTQLKKT